MINCNAKQSNWWRTFRQDRARWAEVDGYQRTTAFPYYLLLSLLALVFLLVSAGSLFVERGIATREDLFIKAFEDPEFYGVRLLKRDAQSWPTVAGIEFRSVTVEAFKGKQGECFELNQAVIYHGPFREMLDDDGHRIRRGDHIAICDKTFQLYKKAPYAEFCESIEPHMPVKPEHAKPYGCGRTKSRHPRETKGMAYNAITDASKC